MRSLRVVGITLVLLAVAAAGQTAPQPEAKLSADDYAIFNAVLKQAFEKSKSEQIVLLDETSAAYPPGMAAMTSFGIRDKAFADAFTPEMREKFSAENKAHLALDKAQITCPTKCTFVDDTTLEKIFGKDGGQWDAYYKQFPKSQGVSNVSRPAYDAKGNVAIVYLATSSNMLAGTGYLFLLDKKPEGWTVRSSQMVWIS